MGMNGTQMLLKSMGIDPAEIMQGIEAFKGTVVEVQATQKRVEEKLDLILGKLETLLQATPGKDGVYPVDAAIDNHLEALRLQAGETDPESQRI